MSDAHFIQTVRMTFPLLSMLAVGNTRPMSWQGKATKRMELKAADAAFVELRLIWLQCTVNYVHPRQFEDESPDDGKCIYLQMTANASLFVDAHFGCQWFVLISCQCKRRSKGADWNEFQPVRVQKVEPRCLRS